MSNRAKSLLLLLIDFILLVLSLMIVIYIKKLGSPSEKYIYHHLHLFSFIFPFWILIYFIEGLYSLRTYNPANLPISIIRSTTLAFFVSIMVIYFSQSVIGIRQITPKTNLLLVCLASMPLIYGWRRFFFAFFGSERRLRGVLLIGSQETLNLVDFEIKRRPFLGYKIVKALTLEEASNLTIPPEVEILAVDRNITKNQNLYDQIFSLLGTGVEITDLAKFAEQISGKIPITAIDMSWFIEHCGHQESRSYDYLKSAVDITVAIILLIILIPVAAILIPLLLIVHGRPIFFKQKRTGLNNKPFTLYKLRTMVVDAEKNGAQWAKPGDARVTPLGKLLRKTRLDELPQLLNIVRGEMSLVGPRPERPEIIEKQLAPHIPFYGLRHLVKPGVTGWAQIIFRYGFSQEDSKEKLQYDLYYVKNRSLWLDVLVILKTIKTVLTGAGQ